jgi:two-component system chemotaxis response regulator CheB
MTFSPLPAVVTVGASAGGVEALRELAAGLPVDFPGAVLMVLHVPPTGMSALPAILQRVSALPARHAVDKEPIRPGHILIAPPDHHLLVMDSHVRLTRGPRENGHRPAVDVLFRSAARAFGKSATGVVLSGSQDDGAAGMVAINQRGGRTLVQDFDEALHNGMPRAAAAAVGLEQGLLVKEIVATLVESAEAAVRGQQPPPSPLMEIETALAEMEPDAMHEHDRPGESSGYACPDCHGVLFAIQEGDFLRFRCRVGHAWSPESLAARQTLELEGALWMALRSLEEKATLHHDLSRRALEHGNNLSAMRFREGEQEALEAAELVRELVVSLGAPSTEAEETR